MKCNQCDHACDNHLAEQSSVIFQRNRFRVRARNLAVCGYEPKHEIRGHDIRPRQGIKARRKAHEVLEFCGLAARADTLASQLIPSEKRRLEVARALATEPKLLLLDEVLTGLTPIEAQTGVELVRKVRATGVTVLMVEHVMEIVMPLVDRAIVLDLGKVLVEGKPTDVVRDPKVISAYLGDRHAVGA